MMKLIVDRAESLFMQSEGACDVTPAQCRVLLYLQSRDGEAVAQRDIERHLGVSHTTVKGLLQRLEEKGLVRTAFDSADGRVKNAYLTEAYRQRHEDASESIQRLESRMLAGLDDAEREQLHKLLERIMANIIS